MSFVNGDLFVLAITLHGLGDISRRRNGAYWFFEAQSWFFGHEGNICLNLTNLEKMISGGGRGGEKHIKNNCQKNLSKTRFFLYPPFYNL